MVLVCSILHRRVNRYRYHNVLASRVPGSQDPRPPVSRKGHCRQKHCPPSWHSLARRWHFEGVATTIEIANDRNRERQKSRMIEFAYRRSGHTAGAVVPFRLAAITRSDT